MNTIHKMVDEVVKHGNANKVLDEYVLKRNVHGYTTRTDLSKELGQGIFKNAFTGWTAITKTPTVVKYMMKTNAGTFLFSCKYGEKGVVVELIWPKAVDKNVLKKFVNIQTPAGQADLAGVPVGNKNYGAKVLFPVDEGGHVKASTYIKPLTKLAFALTKVAKKAKSRYLDVSGTEEPKSKTSKAGFEYGLRDLDTGTI